MINSNKPKLFKCRYLKILFIYIFGIKNHNGNSLIFFTGTPAYKVLAFNSPLTTLPAATTTPSLIILPGSIITLPPIQQPSLIITSTEVTSPPYV